MFQNGNKNKFLLRLFFLLSSNKLKIETNKAHIHETCFHRTPNTTQAHPAPRRIFSHISQLWIKLPKQKKARQLEIVKQINH